MSAPVELVTPRLRLRRAEARDLEAMHAILSDAQAMRFWSSSPHADIEQTRVWLGDMIAGEEASDDFVVEFEGRVVGKAGCWRLPEIGYILHPEVWGRGLAREALSAVLAHVFEAHGLPAITADVDPRNLASLRLLARLGFKEIGRASATWEVGAEVFDSVYLALRRAAFASYGSAIRKPTPTCPSAP